MLEESYEPTDDENDADDEDSDDGWDDTDLYGGDPTDPEIYDNGENSQNFDVVTEDSELERYVVELERIDVRGCTVTRL